MALQGFERFCKACNRTPTQTIQQLKKECGHLYFQRFGIEFELRFSFFLLLSVVILMDKTGLLALMLFFIFVHELGHIIGFFLFGVSIKSISLHPFGVKIKRSNHSKALGQELCIYFFGPLSNFICMGLIWIFGNGGTTAQTAIVLNFVMAAFNLLPIGNLDGGNMLQLLLRRYSRAERFDGLFKALSLMGLIPLFLLAISLALGEGHNITLLITCIYLCYMVI